MYKLSVRSSGLRCTMFLISLSLSTRLPLSTSLHPTGWERVMVSCAGRALGLYSVGGQHVRLVATRCTRQQYRGLARATDALVAAACPESRSVDLLDLGGRVLRSVLPVDFVRGEVFNRLAAGREFQESAATLFAVPVNMWCLCGWARLQTLLRVFICLYVCLWATRILYKALLRCCCFLLLSSSSLSSFHHHHHLRHRYHYYHHCWH